MADNTDQTPGADPDHTPPAAADQARHLSEEWPDPDDACDSDTSKGRRAAQRVEDALCQDMERHAAERDRQFRGPDKAYQIPAELYEKADKDNDRLTDDERALLLGRGDVVGKALARPDELSLEERYRVLQWSPPDVLHAAIRAATEDALGTPEELYALARDAADLARLRPEVKRIVAGMFWVDWETATHWPRRYWRQTPGNAQATSLLYKRAGMDPAFLVFAMYSLGIASTTPAPGEGPRADDTPADHEPSPSGGTQRPFNLQEAMASVPRPPPFAFTGRRSYLNASLAAMRDHDDGPPRKRTAPPPSRDAAGTWPPGLPPQLAKPSRLFWHEVMREDAEFQGQYFDDVVPHVERRWRALSGAEQAVYAARSEALRQQAWDEVDERAALWTRGETELAGLIKPFTLPGMDEFLERQMQEIMKRARPPGPVKEPEPWGRNSRDSEGKVEWPAHVSFRWFRPLGLFWDEQKARYPGQQLQDVWKTDDIGVEVGRRFEALGEEERAAYGARSETLRQEVWDEWEEYERKLARGEMVSMPRLRQHP